MVNDDHHTPERVPHGLGGANVGAHVHVLAFRPDQALVERIEHHDSGDDLAKLGRDVGNEQPVLCDQVSLPGHDVERHSLVGADLIVAAHCLDALPYPCAPSNAQ